MYTEEHRKNISVAPCKSVLKKIDDRGRNAIKKKARTVSALPFFGDMLIPALPVSSAVPVQPSMQIFNQIRNYPYCYPPYICSRRFTLYG